MLSNVLEKARGILVNGIEFMEGREKGELELNKEYVIVDFDFLSSADGEYVVFIDRNDDKNFYFGGQVITQKLKEIKELLTERELAELLDNGIPVKFEEKKSQKSRRKYIACEFML